MGWNGVNCDCQATSYICISCTDADPHFRRHMPWHCLVEIKVYRAKFFNLTFIFISVDLCTSCQRTWYVWIHLHGNIVRSWYSPMSHCEGQAWGDIRECEVSEVWPLQWVVVLYILPCHMRPWYMSGMYSTGPHRNLDFQTPMARSTVHRVTLWARLYLACAASLGCPSGVSRCGLKSAGSLSSKSQQIWKWHNRLHKKLAAQILLKI